MASGILKKAKYGAATAAVSSYSAAAASALSEPLLASETNKPSVRETDSVSSSSFDSGNADVSSNESSFSSEELLYRSLSGKDLITSALVSLVATGGVAASVGAMVAFPTAMVFIMGGICIVNSPTMAHKHIKIAKSAGIRDTVSSLRKEINLLRGEIDFLTRSIDDLHAESDV